MEAKYLRIPDERISRGYRNIRYAFHDVDGTHSLIRNWPPVMSVVLNDVIENGLPEGYDSQENVIRLTKRAGSRMFEETDRFCIESAGLSGLTQMEWAIRRAIQEGKIIVNCNQKNNSFKIEKIWQGEETFEEKDTPEMEEYLSENTPKLFKLYEKVLNAYCRDVNLDKAKKDPESFMVKGSKEFLDFLHEHGVKNYFVTGAVVEEGKGMFEEVEGLGYDMGERKQVEALIGSSWNHKLPKIDIMKELAAKLNARGEEILVVGDGRSEITAGRDLGAYNIGRLGKGSDRQREILKECGADIIIEDYYDEKLREIFSGQWK